MTDKTILVVDDEPVNLAVLARLLQPIYRVRAVNSGARALRAAATLPTPDLILLDVMMPEMDGYTVLARLREQPITRAIPVIFVTALGAEENEQHGLELGAVDYLTKPIKSAIVLARIRTHLELKQARDQLADQNTWLEHEVARRTHENLLIQDVTLGVLAGLVETRDTDTGNHTLRTQAFVEALAQRLRQHPQHTETLDERQLALLVKAAPLHDIGKIGIPDRILLKQGPLTAEEFEIMKTHCRIGGEAIARAMRHALARAENLQTNSSLAFLEMARVIATSHHERWDGAGYPDGLANTAIPLPARIMTIADVFDALTMRRVYKGPMSADEAASHIIAQSGRQFDPDIVAAFVAARSDFADIAQHYAHLESAA